ncbi:MAG: hypothetical protein ACLU38_15075 [Dysosmobacter sp.]
MRLCVIGDPVGHSLSPRIHRRFMERCGAAGSYEASDGDGGRHWRISWCRAARGAWDRVQRHHAPEGALSLPAAGCGGAVDGTPAAP